MERGDGLIVPSIERKNLLGVRLSAATYESATAAILCAARRRVPFGVSALAVHGLMSGVLDPRHRYRLNQMELLVPDGQPVRWALNWMHGTGLRDRVYGPNLMLHVLKAASQQSLPVALFGGSADLLSRLESKLMERFPDLKIAATVPSRFRKITPVEKQELVARIVGSGARLAFVGLGCPRQEVWTHEFRQQLSMPVVAVGAAFSFHAGELAQAPEWMQKIGMEWFFRLTREPRRLWQRYLFLNPYYVALVALQWSRLWEFDPDSSIQPEEEILYG